MTLAELKIGQSARILAVGGEGALRCRLLDMGDTAQRLFPAEFLISKLHLLVSLGIQNPDGFILRVRILACDEDMVITQADRIYAFIGKSRPRLF